jgi:hypothetical protein
MEDLEPPGERPEAIDALLSTGRACGLLLALALLAWVTGRPFLFPSLGPSAYALAVTPSAATSRWQRVLGGHLLGVGSGFLAYHAIAAGASVAAVPPPASVPGLRLVAAGLLAMALTTLTMLGTDLRHAPACATTLIVGLGLLTTPLEAGIVLVSVALLTGVDALLPRASIEDPTR